MPEGKDAPKPVAPKDVLALAKDAGAQIVDFVAIRLLSLLWAGRRQTVGTRQESPGKVCRRLRRSSPASR